MLDKMIFMRQPPRFARPGEENLVCLLLKAIYGLKQAGCEWYKELHTLFMQLSFTRSAHDHPVFFKKENGNISIVAVHVDNLTLTANSKNTMAELKQQLSAHLNLST
jgi:hypothetical protein